MRGTHFDAQRREPQKDLALDALVLLGREGGGLDVSRFDKVGGARRKFLRDGEKRVRALVGKALRAVLVALDVFLHHRAPFKGMRSRRRDRGRKPSRTRHLGDAAASRAVGGLDDERVGERFARQVLYA